MLLGGCGGQMSDSQGQDSNTASTNSDANAGSDASADGSVLTIRIAKQLDGNTGRYGSGEDINNNPMVNMAVEKLGIRMETTLLGGDAGNYDTKLRLALTGSEDLPDVFPVYGTQMIVDMIESGRVKDITNDIEQYMPDRIKEIYKNFPETYYPLTKDGKIYGIACCPVLTEGEVMIIRQDWLDNLGLKAPTNMDEFEAVIKVFTEDDPDGNGQKDTYGFAYSGSDLYNTGWVSDPVPLFSANSGKFIPGAWREDENGNLMYGSIHEGNRKTLKMQPYANVASGKEPETSAEIRAAADFENAPSMAAGYALAYEHRDEQLPNMFDAEPTATMRRSWEQLQTMDKQVYINIIYGNEPIEAFDKFVEDWKAQGGEQITQEVNEWYQSVK